MRWKPPRVLAPAAWIGALTIFLVFALVGVSAPGQEEARPTLTIDEDCAAFEFAPDGRIAYAVRHLMKTKHYDLERDDIWVTSPDGKRKRIVEGEKLVKSSTPYSYAIHAISWSPDSHRLAVEMLTDQVIDEKGTTREGQLVDLMDDEGKEINIAGTKNSALENAYQAVWLGDGQTVAYLEEVVKPKLLFGISTVRPAGGRGGSILEGHTFTAVSWDAKHNSAVAIERDRSLTGPIKLVQFDLIRQSVKDVAVLDGFIGQLVLSPSATKVAYFHDGNTLEVRDLSSPGQAARVTAAFGRYEWAPDEKRVLLKRGATNKSSDLIWVHIPGGNFDPVLHDLLFRDFSISADGRWLGVTQPGKRILMVYPLP
jgi:hypothetical protein